MTVSNPPSGGRSGPAHVTRFDRRSFLSTGAAGLGAAALGLPGRARAAGRKEISFATPRSSAARVLAIWSTASTKARTG